MDTAQVFIDDNLVFSPDIESQFKLTLRGCKLSLLFVFYDIYSLLNE